MSVKTPARSAGCFGVVSLHADGMRDLGEAPGQAAKRAGLRGRASRSKGVALESGGRDARRGRGSGHDGDGRPPASWPQWALTPILRASRGPRPSAMARQIGQRNAGGRTSGAGVRRPRAAPASRTEELAAGPVPSQTSCETIATPHAYTGRASRSRRARLRSPVRASMISRFGEPDDLAWRWGSLGALDEALSGVRSALSGRSRAHRPAGGHSDGGGPQRAVLLAVPRRLARAEVRQPEVLPRDSSGLPGWRRMGRARSVDVDAVDRQRRGGASACDEPGAEAEEGGSRTHAEQRCNDSAEDSAEDSDQQSARLRRLAVGRDRTRDPARYNSQDHPTGEAHCACTFDNAGHETSVHSQDQVAPHDRRCGHLGPYGLRPISPPREPHTMARAGRCVASLNHSQSPNGCRNPFPQGLRPRTLTTYIAPLTGSLPWRKPHRSLAMGAVAPVVHPPCRRPGPAPPVTSEARRGLPSRASLGPR